MRKLNSKVRTSFISEEGTYLQNKDYFAFVELDKLACYVVADGIDDDNTQESAEIVVTSIIKDFTEKPTMKPSLIRKYINNANRELIHNSNNVRLKASVMIVVSDYSKIRYAMVGNARFYYFKDGHIRIKSKDQSLTEQMAEKGLVSLDRVSKHIERNNLTSFLGEDKIDKPIVSPKIKLDDGDVFALLTRGIWENCGEVELEDALEGVASPAEVVDDVEEIILSKQPEVIENYTVSFTFFDKVFVNPNKGKNIKKILMVAIPVMVLIATIATVMGMKIKNKKEALKDMKYSISSGDQYLEDNNAVRANEEYKEAKKIAEKYNVEDKLDEIDKKIKYTENISTGDKLLKSGKYDEAIGQYLIALDKSAKYDNRCKDYIEKKISFTQDCIRINELMDLGDKELENKNYSSADANYKAAKELATQCNLSTERNAAQDKLKEVADLLSAENDEKKAEEKAKKEKGEQAYIKGTEYMKNGDDAYVSGNYVGAIKQYKLAKEQFEVAESKSLVEEIDSKLDDIDQLIHAKENEAVNYVRDARNLVSENKKDEAKVKYRQAQEIYKNLEMIDVFNEIEDEINRI